MEQIIAAATAGRTFTFVQTNPKRSTQGNWSRKRYDYYKGETTFAGLEALKGVNFPGTTRPVFNKGVMTKGGDFANDVAAGFVTFVEATVSPTAALSASAMQAAAVPRAALARCCGGRPLDCVAARASAMPRGPLSEDESAMLAAVRAWGGPAAGVSKRASSATHGVPAVLVRAAVAVTSGGTLLASTVDDSTLLFDIRSGGGGAAARPTLSHNFERLRGESDWASGILPAMKKEIGGLVSSVVWDEVPWEPWMKQRLIRTHRIDERKSDGKNKSRFVAQGNRTVAGVHFDEVATSMPTQTAIKMVVSFAAGLRQGLFALDFSQAFINAPCGKTDLYIELPDLPTEMQTGEFGSSKSSGMVGHLRKALYGLRDSPRLWQRFLLKFLAEDVGARVLVSDRNVLKWAWRGMTLLMVVHVDDVLFTPSTREIHMEFLRVVRSKFTITGGEEMVSKFCGYQFRFDAHAETITMHQEDFARALLTKYGATDWKPEATPLRVGDPPLEPFGGSATDRSSLEFAMFIGDMTWLTRTNPRLAFAVQDLAQFVQNPGPDHFLAARRVLAHVRKDPGKGLTFHGSETVLNQSYPHRHALIGMTDSGFSHKGAKAVSGCSVLMNGAALYHVARRQTTVSQTSAEAEAKAAALVSEVLSSVVPLWSEIAGAEHPAVRVFIDNKAAKKQCESGTDTVASAPYLRSKAYCESKIYAGLLWLDFVPGCDNGADMGTKQIPFIPEFEKKDGVLSGTAPFLFESEEVTKLLLTQARAAR